MRRGLLLLALGLALGAPAAAQTPRVGLSIGLTAPRAPDGPRAPRVRVENLLLDPRWSQALDQSFPIRLFFRLEIWRSRDGWIDEFQRATEWSMLVQREPLQDQYRATEILQAGTQETRFATREELARWVGTTREVDALPRGEGIFYYTLRLRVTALSDQDMDELEQFLAGDVEAPRSERGSVARGVRRLLLRMAGLPWEDLEVRSERFPVVRRQ